MKPLGLKNIKRGENTMVEFKTWRDIKEWFEDNDYIALAKRMQLNNDCWNSSGEFGRSQMAICDAMRFTQSEEDRHEVAKTLIGADELIELGLVN